MKRDKKAMKASGITLTIVGLVWVAGFMGLWMTAQAPAPSEPPPSDPSLTGIPGSVKTSIHILQRDDGQDFTEANDQEAIEIAKEDPRVQELLGEGATISGVKYAMSKDESELMAVVEIELGDKGWAALVDLDRRKVLNVMDQSRIYDSIADLALPFGFIVCIPGLLVLGLGIVQLLKAKRSTE